MTAPTDLAGSGVPPTESASTKPGRASFAPVMQTKFYEPDAPPERQRGNCLTAVVASLMHLPIDAVPNFVQDDVNSNGAEPWWNSLLSWVRARGGQVVLLRDEHQPDSPWPLPESGEPYTVVGVSPRDPRIHHIVIYVGGLLAHDPYPGGGGVLPPLSNDYRWTIRPTCSSTRDECTDQTPCPTCAQREGT